MAEETGNVSIDFANQIIEHITALVDEKSDEASVWAQDTVTAARQQAGDVRATSVKTSGAPLKPGLPNRPTLPSAPVVGKMAAAPLLRRPPDMPAAPDLPDAPNLDGLNADDMVNEFSTIQGDLIAELKAALIDFAERWFPPGQYMEKATAWLERAIDGGATINAQVEAALWERDRARLTAEASRATDETLTLWAGRGYALPPGALAHQVLTINMGLSNALNQQSRDIAIKAHADEIESAKFAVQQAIGLRTSAMSAAINFIQALASSMSQAIQLTTGKADALARIASAKAAVFSAESDALTRTFGAVSSASTENYKAETGAQTDVFRAEVAGFQAKTGAETDAYRALTSAEIETYKTLAGALTDVYRAETGAADLDLRAKTATAQMDLEAQRANQSAELSQIQEQVKALAANAAQIAAQCAAAIQGLRMSAGVTNGSTTTMSIRA